MKKLLLSVVLLASCANVIAASSYSLHVNRKEDDKTITYVSSEGPEGIDTFCTKSKETGKIGCEKHHTGFGMPLPLPDISEEDAKIIFDAMEKKYHQDLRNN